ncbi:3'(2'),5'-bisphosphate nucleotidase CysQ family protein [Methylobacterium planeticum]|uniref:3'(2'),5'-bisphosphate nucleotidase CysQ n=1 Tax=Methylobacterium planeticum TaxID=2615211 RepID=A0A6N6MTB1_9HYPH|nr:3'(2'),5'-bisphosphate nucleotidase CysQ [Methylobacterium planeticum]KAB1075118.1 3'(2'),5'-bisphosphate nucleotidase CysQ [Methylobacterium planeticum]
MTLSETQRDRIAATLAGIACEAGEILRAHHGGDCPHVIKPDGSPSSVADLQAEQLILSALAQACPGIPVVAEETCHNVPPADLFFLVDPLDGTRDFLAGNPEYSVNIGLVEGNRPVAAALAAPGVARVWFAGTSAFEAPIRAGRVEAAHPIHARQAPPAGLVALVSRRHGDSETEACLAGLPIESRRGAASALKFCLIASGEADIYVRCGPTMEWDTAAGDHVLTVAGGCVVAPTGRPMVYGRHALSYRNGPFAALGDPAYLDRLDLPDRGPLMRPQGEVLAELHPAVNPEPSPR